MWKGRKGGGKRRERQKGRARGSGEGEGEAKERGKEGGYGDKTWQTAARGDNPRDAEAGQRPPLEPRRHSTWKGATPAG